ncbi:MAG: pyruvate dehydrogenase (acetyl-transferring) E1 component subunit alpha [Fimbriimonas ginsengisoli]|uniref:Pyruvate dehydrogenase (Acetyl-transferring) E1 component subunit alpha n=1 Tax=Fimbriimonas ginsengisoli TaxID=1005039 RepID=A0A931LUK5_FIMGI|nr:pyruvate dehydrogenase (acetyl-transferring) E1 component subunit alpha [Fimbriimonas ginsengisoli]
MAKPAHKDLIASPAEVEQDYRDMLFLRHFEEKCNAAYRAGKVGGYLHVYIGMEPLAVGWLGCIKKGYDRVIAPYRIHGHALTLGSDPVKVMAEIMGRAAGLSHGKGGSMHLYDVEKGFYGGWGIVGGHTPIAAGLAFADKYRNEDRITLCYLGDGAANAGVFFETLNMVGLWDLPIIFLIENNLFAMGTRIEYHAADTELWKRGVPFGIHSERVDGMDVFQVKRDAQRIIDRVRRQQKPALVEVMTYRFAGHGAADNDQSLYRTPKEVEEARRRDPIALIEGFIREHNLMTQEKMEAIDAEIVERVEDIYHQADALPFPEPGEVYEHVYTDMLPEEGH